MQQLTVFTPTYNRAELLPRAYAALLRQTNKDFVWLIVDDGSTDDTENLVKLWQQENKIVIFYFKKENGGLHTAYNLGIEKTDTELFVCIDSDDYMPDDAVDGILKLWNFKKSPNLAGIIGLDYGMDGNPLHGKLLPDIEKVHIIELATRYQHNVDTKMVHRSELLKQVAPMKVFPGEKNFNPIYLFLKIDDRYPLLVLNKNLCFVDYQETGMANNILQQFVNSPNSFAELRKLNMSLSKATPFFVFKNAIHYVSSCLLAGKKDWFSDSPKKAYTLLAAPFGFLLYLYLRYKTN